MQVKKETFSVCVLAHNEERSIERTLRAIMNADSSPFPITVYANGCSDQTHQIVSTLGETFKNIKSVEIKIASKINAWNTAFSQEEGDIIIFCDGDIVPERNAVNQLVQDLLSSKQLTISSTRLFPLWRGLSFEQMLVAFMQLPLSHEFLSGGMYAVKRDQLKQKFDHLGLEGIPKGVTGEDYFLERLIESTELYISHAKNFYMPPSLKDYFRYLARIRWQNEQMALVLGNHRDTHLSLWKVILRKIFGHKYFLYLFISIPAVSLRLIFKKVYAHKIEMAYKYLGPVIKDGEHVLTSQTRSHSTK